MFLLRQHSGENRASSSGKPTKKGKWSNKKAKPAIYSTSSDSIVFFSQVWCLAISKISKLWCKWTHWMRGQFQFPCSFFPFFVGKKTWNTSWCPIRRPRFTDNFTFHRSTSQGWERWATAHGERLVCFFMCCLRTLSSFLPQLKHCLSWFGGISGMRYPLVN